MDLARLLVVLPNAMASRAVLGSGVLAALAGEEGLAVKFVSQFPADAEPIAAQGSERLTWADLGWPIAGSVRITQGGAARAARRLAHRVYGRISREYGDFGNLVYRFNEIHGFQGHCFKKALPPARREREALAGNFCDPSLGRPFPRSRALLDALHRLYWSSWYGEPQVDELFQAWRPHLVAVYHVQNQAVRPYVCAARARGVPILGVVGSWDQPTTKGPLPPGLAQVAVQSSRMARELAAYHGVAPGRVQVTGWPTMDAHADAALKRDRAEFLASQGLDPARQLIVLGANSARLGAHEPAIAAHLARRVAEGAYGGPATLLIRPHPMDGAWADRFGGLNDPPRVVVTPAEKGRLEVLANLMEQAGAVIASSGSILLDALAHDTPAVGIAFDGDSMVDYSSSIARFYEMDHYRPVVESGGVILARSYPELDRLVGRALSDPAAGAAGRARCRAEQLEPLDGQAGARLARLMATAALRAAAEGEAA